MARTIAQRVLRNGARMIEVVAAGEDRVVTRNGAPVAELRSIRQTRRTFVRSAALPLLVANGPRIDRKRLNADLDRVVDQGLQMAAGPLDTSVAIDRDDPTVAASLREAVAVCAITLAELAAGPHLARSTSESPRRQARLQQVEASYGQVVAAVANTGRSHRRRGADLLIAATAHANGLPLSTRNSGDFVGLDDLVAVVGV